MSVSSARAATKAPTNSSGASWSSGPRASGSLLIMSERDARGRASVRVSGGKGGSPFQACPLRPVTDCNCVAVRRGGEQREVKKSSVGTRTRFGRTDWRACDRKAKPRPALTSGKPMTLKGWVQKRSWEAVRWLETEGFEGQTTLSGETCAVPASSRPVAGVRALIVAVKPGNAGGAKGCRKVET